MSDFKEIDPLIDIRLQAAVVRDQIGSGTLLGVHEHRERLLAEVDRLAARLAEVESRAWSLLGAIERQPASAQIGATGIGHHACVLRRYLEGTPDSASVTQENT